MFWAVAFFWKNRSFNLSQLSRYCGNYMFTQFCVLCYSWCILSYTTTVNFCFTFCIGSIFAIEDKIKKNFLFLLILNSNYFVSFSWRSAYTKTSLQQILTLKVPPDALFISSSSLDEIQMIKPCLLLLLVIHTLNK